MTELFQLDEAESLDFGIYRIIKRHNREVRDFLGEIVVEKEQKSLKGGLLSAKLEEAFSSADAETTADDKYRLIQLEKDLSLKAGMSPAEREAQLVTLEKISATANMVAEYRSRKEQKDSASTAIGDRTEVLNRLYQFFARHYQDGDFIVERRYGRDGSRYIRSTGEDTEFHWATEDMYYIKSGDTFTDFPVKLSKGQRLLFTVEPESLLKTRAELKPSDKAHYELDAVTTDEDGAFQVSLKYLKGGQSDKHKDGIASAVEKACGGDSAEIKRWLNHFIARNQSDFFIHKRLKEALAEDLDIFIKIEIMDADQLLIAGDLPRRIIKVARIVREVGRQIIDFLAALEDFQKALWEKKKLVFETRYVITLDRIEKLAGKEWLEAQLERIVAGQREEWRTLGLGDIAAPAACRVEIPGDLLTAARTRYLPLPVDTAHFDEEFKWALLAVVTGQQGLDEALDGVAIHSDNWQALNVLQAKYCGQVKCCYIDPPYNTDAGPIAYKNGYRSASWIAMMQDRLMTARSFLKADGVLCVTIDDYEQKTLGLLLERVFGSESIAGVVTIRINPSGRPKPSGFAVSHEYAYFVRNSLNSTLDKLERTTDQMKRYKEVDDDGAYMWELFRKRGSNSEQKDRPTLYYPLFVSISGLRVPKMQWQEEARSWQLLEAPLDGESEIYPIDDNGVHRTWRWKNDEVTKTPTSFRAVKNDDGRWTVYYKFRPSSSGVLPTTVWVDSKYSATEHGTGTLKQLFKELDVFSYPKSIHAVIECLKVAGSSEDESLYLDFFAGSGTTGHAITNMNGGDDIRRRFLLTEVNAYFETVIVPRMKKLGASTEWNSGIALSLDGPGLFMRVQSLEQYEDTLENLDTDIEQQKELPFDDPAFALRYRLDRTTRQVFSSIESFTSPFGYKLKRSAGGGEAQPRQVDLTESLIYLLGLDVARLYREPQGVVITGHDRRKRTVAVFFRDCAAADSAAWAEAKLAAHPAERVLINDPASLTFEECDRFEAIESVFAGQFGRT
jgi:adenine-specific DNA-methyltransferase